MLNGLDLFSGIGGISLALSEWVKTVAYCEQDRYAQAVLLSRMSSGDIDRAPIWDDVKTLAAEILPRIDIISGGFPCQDISVAGLGKGLGGERSGLFFEIVRLCRDLRPRFIFLENVPAITIRGLDRVCLELTSLGYDCRWTIVSAAEMGAVHIRHRWFLLAHANDARHCGSGKFYTDGRESPTMQQRNDPLDISGDNGSAWNSAGTSQGFTQPRVFRTGDGVSNRAHRAKGLGNSVVPQQVREAFKRLAGIEGLK